jgi:hypothetical protein
MKKWELFEKKKSGVRADLVEVKERYNAKVEKAKEDLVAAHSELESVLRSEFKGGKELLAEKLAARSKVANSEEALQDAEAEQVKASEYVMQETLKDRVDFPDLVNDWNNSYVPSVREEELNPIIERIAKARAEYLNGIVDYYELKRKYKGLHFEISQGYLDDRRHKKGPHAVVKEVTTLHDLSLINSKDLHDAETYLSLPHDVKRVKVGEQ